MPLRDLGIKDTDYAGMDIASVPDRPEGSAAEVKALFDRLVKELVSVRYNELLALLQSPEAAGEIGGAAVGQLPAGNVQGLLQALYDWFTETGGAGRVGVTAIDGVLGQTVQAALEGVQANIRTLGDAGGAARIGVAPFSGVTARDVQGALAELRKALDDLVGGMIPDFSVDTEKLADRSVTTEKLADSAATTRKLADGAVTFVKLAGEVLDAVYQLSIARMSSELDDYTVETGTFVNAGAGWNAYRFHCPFASPPAVTLTAEAFEGYAEVRDVTAEGFLYRLRSPEWTNGQDGTEGKVTTESIYVATGTGSSPSHSSKTVVTGVTLPTLPEWKMTATGEKYKIHYIAVAYGGEYGC